MSQHAPVLSIRGLSVGFPSSTGVEPVLRGVDLEVAPGETLGIVGESGSGKSMTALSVLRLLPPQARVLAGEVFVEGRDVLTMPLEAMRPYRGGTVGFIFQDATSALDPSFTVGSQLIEALRAHRPEINKSQARQEAAEFLDAVEIPDPVARLRQYPHQLSGGMRQRCMIAIAIANRPRLVIADEPTTALDVTLQAKILQLIKRMIADTGTAMMLIAHDIAVIAEMADRIAVMYAGKVVETGPAHDILVRPRHPYTAALQRSLPQIARPGERLAVIGGHPPVSGQFPTGCAFHPRCDVRGGRERCITDDPPLEAVSTDRFTACHFHADVATPALGPGFAAGGTVERAASTPLVEIHDLCKTFYLTRGRIKRRHQGVPAADHLNLEIQTGETLAVVGESGSGKTTLGRLIIGLQPVDTGRILFEGQDITSLSQRAMRAVRRNIQMVFQDPYSSLNPRLTAREVVAEPLRLHGLLDQAGWKRVDSLLDRVGLDPTQFARYPSEFSGGQRQRIGIARALALEPKLVILDEPVSALDVSIQAQILNLIAELQREQDLTYMFISHDLAVVAQIADRIAVMQRGELVELGHRDQIFRTPEHPYTKTLLEAIPKLPTESRERSTNALDNAGSVVPPSPTGGS